ECAVLYRRRRCAAQVAAVEEAGAAVASRVTAEDTTGGRQDAMIVEDAAAFIRWETSDGAAVGDGESRDSHGLSGLNFEDAEGGRGSRVALDCEQSGARTGDGYILVDQQLTISVKKVDGMRIAIVAVHRTPRRRV